MDHYIFNKEEYNDLFSEEVSVKRHKELLAKADLRFGYIISQIDNIVGRSFEWFDFSNETPRNEDSVRGYFDKDLYKEKIAFTGQFKATKNQDFDKYDESFPTSWLTNEFERDLKQELVDFITQKDFNDKMKIAQAQKKVVALENINEKLPQLQDNVYKKLPPDIMDNLTFKKAERIYYENSLDARNKELLEITDTINKQREVLRTLLTPEEFHCVDFKSPEKILQERETQLSRQKPKIK